MSNLLKCHLHIRIEPFGWWCFFIGSDPYRIDAVAALPSDFVTYYPNYPIPFPFSNDDLVEQSHLFIGALQNDTVKVQYQNSNDTFFTNGLPVPKPANHAPIRHRSCWPCGFGRKKFLNKK